MERVKTNPLLNWIKWRIDHNKNCIIVINGPTGSSKSYDALSLGSKLKELMKTNFTVKTNVAFDFKSMIKNTRLPENNRKGTAFVFEEVGVVGGGAMSREWQSKANKLFFSFIQTARHKNQILIFTCPHFADLELGARTLVHLQITTAGIDFKRRIAYVKPYVLQVNPKTRKIYFKYLRFSIKKKVHKLKLLEISHPPDNLVEKYEEMKLEFTSRLEESILEEEKKEKRTPTMFDMDVYLLKKQKRESNAKIAEFFGFSERKLYLELKEYYKIPKYARFMQKNPQK